MIFGPAISADRTAPPLRVRFGQSWASVHLDLLRAVAAFFVLAEHARNFFFVDFFRLDVPHRRFWILPYALTSLGHQAVVLFFLLSGLLIGSSVLQSFQKGTWRWSDYATRRLVRLWIVLVPGLFLCLLLDTSGSHLEWTRHMYFGDAGNHMLFDVAKHLDPITFLGNLLFVQTVSVPYLGSDGALWSLANEFWYYVLFPLGLIVFLKSRRWSERIICAVLFILICIWLRSTLLPMFPIWLAGVGVWLLPKRRLSKWAYFLFGFIYLGISIVLAQWRTVPLLARDYLYAVATGLLLWAALSFLEPAPDSKQVRIVRFAARGSYSLYLVHMPFLALMAAFFIHGERWQPTSQHIVIALGITGLATIYAYTVAFFTEFRTDRVRQWITSLMSKEDIKPLAVQSSGRGD